MLVEGADGGVSAFHERLAAIMAERGITQAELARQMGMHRVTAHNWYWGMTEPSIEKLIRIRRILRCEWDELLGR